MLVHEEATQRVASNPRIDASIYILGHRRKQGLDLSLQPLETSDTVHISVAQQSPQLVVQLLLHLFRADASGEKLLSLRGADEDEKAKGFCENRHRRSLRGGYIL